MLDVSTRDCRDAEGGESIPVITLLAKVETSIMGHREVPGYRILYSPHCDDTSSTLLKVRNASGGRQ